jgi:hypothetical protein
VLLPVIETGPETLNVTTEVTAAETVALLRVREVQFHVVLFMVLAPVRLQAPSEPSPKSMAKAGETINIRNKRIFIYKFYKGSRLLKRRYFVIQVEIERINIGE